METTALKTVWSELALQVLAGRVPSEQNLHEILACPDGEILSLLDAAYQIRKAHFGNRVQLY